jgi:excisionase family DNA binding protein
MASVHAQAVRPERLLLKQEARRRLRVSLPTLDRMIARGDLEVIKLSSRTVRISESAITALIRQRTERRSI